MFKEKTMKRIIRSLAVIISILVLVSGVTYAALQSTLVTLKGNTIQTALASLQLSTDGVTYSGTIAGFSFVGLVPGGSAVPASGYPVYIRNVGTAPLSARVSLAKPPTNADNADLSKVHLVLTSSTGTVQSITLADLISSATTGGTPVAFMARVSPGQTQTCTIQVSLDADAVGGPGATIGDIDISFGGVAVN
jgi:hypothetical protein